jgi:hypothetical protein
MRLPSQTPLLILEKCRLVTHFKSDSSVKRKVQKPQSLREEPFRALL